MIAIIIISPNIPPTIPPMIDPLELVELSFSIIWPSPELVELSPVVVVLGLVVGVVVDVSSPLDVVAVLAIGPVVEVVEAIYVIEFIKKGTYSMY